MSLFSEPAEQHSQNCFKKAWLLLLLLLPSKNPLAITSLMECFNALFDRDRAPSPGGSALREAYPGYPERFPNAVVLGTRHDPRTICGE